MEAGAVAGFFAKRELVAEVVEAELGADSVGGVTRVGLLPAGTVSTDPAATDTHFTSGGTVYFKLGNLTNADPVLATAEYVVIEFNALVVNQPSNQAGTTLSNSFGVQFDHGLGSLLTPFNKQSNTVVTDVVEPILALDKAVTGGPATPRKGESVTYTITLTHAAGSGSTAWEATLTDPAPEGLQITAIQSVDCAGGAAVNQAVAITGSGTGLGGVFDIPVGGSVKITYTAVVTSNNPTVRTLTNVADLTWSTLSGTSAFERKSGDSLLNGGGLNDYELTAAKTIQLSTFSYDGIHNFSKPVNGEAHGYPTIGEIDNYREALLPISPVYSGEAEPGSTLIVNLYNANGGNVGSQMVVTDFGGNWLAAFPSTVIRDYPTSVVIVQQSSSSDLTGTSGNNLRTYFASAINQSHFSMETLGSSVLNEYRILPLLESISLEFPLSLGNAKYGYEFLANSGSVGD